MPTPNPPLNGHSLLDQPGRVSVAEVVDSRVFGHPIRLSRSNGRDPVVVPIKLVNDAPTLGCRKHQVLSRLQDCQTLHPHAAGFRHSGF